jgi:hypothetical protein
LYFGSPPRCQARLYTRNVVRTKRRVNITSTSSTNSPAKTCGIGWLADALHLDASTFTDECLNAYRNVDPERIRRGATAAMALSTISVELR